MVMNPMNKIDNLERISNPIERPQVTTDLSENVIFDNGRRFYITGRGLSSLWPLLFGTACCFIEMAAMIGSTL